MTNPKENRGGKCKILSRNIDYVDNDTYGYRAVCSCGEIITEWFESKCEDLVQKHLNPTQNVQ